MEERHGAQDPGDDRHGHGDLRGGEETPTRPAASKGGAGAGQLAPVSARGRALKATSAETSGSTLRRRLANWAAINLLQRVHAVLVAMLRGDPDLILDRCSVRAKRGGDLIGPNPTDRGKQGSKYHVAVTGDGVPVACAVTGANVNDTVLFERLFLMAFAVVAKIRTVFADKGYDAEANRELCRAFGAEPHLHKRGRPHARLRAGQAALAGRAQQRLAAREQAPGAAL